ncbi:MAG: hypothetical protein ABI200_06695 [Gaiellales bacterium]
MFRRIGMEVGAHQRPGYVRAEQTLTRIDAHLKPAYDVAKIGRMAFGDAPISFFSTAVSGVLRATTAGSSNERVKDSVANAGLAADGIARGLFYSGGLLHGALATRMPWLVVARTPPAGFEKIASMLGKFSTVARVGLLGVGGALGALRAAQAIARHGGPEALLRTRDGRGGALQALGSALLIVKHPATYIAGAAVFGLAALNELT